MDKLVNKLCYTLAGIKAAAGNNSKLSDISLKYRSLHGRSVLYLPNGSDHAVIACYLGLYEEGEVEHINGVRPSFPEYTAVSRFVTFLRMLHTW